nr:MULTISPECIES: oligosaccharide flippase family protein [unclassified Cupriavidus]
MIKHTRNLLSLVMIQGSNAALPLLVFPYVLGVVGAQHYADIVVTEAFSVLLITVILYSFEIDGVAAVTGLRPERDRAQLSKIFSRILVLRMTLFTVAAPMLVAGLSLFRPELTHIAAWWMLIPLSYALQPTWLYQGLQANGIPAVCTLLSRAVAVVLILLLVKRPDDFLLVPAIMGVMYALGSVAMLAFAMAGLGIRPTRVRWGELMQMIRAGKEIFLGNVGVALYRDSNVLLLGFLGLHGAPIAAYSLAEKTTKAVQAVIRPLNQLFFPKAVLVTQAANSPNRDVFVRLLRLTWPQLGALVTIWLALMAAVPILRQHVPAIGQIQELDQVMLFMSLMALGTLFGVCNFMFGSAGLNTLGQKRALLGGILFAAVVSVIATATLGGVYGAIGAAISFTLSEGVLFATIARKYYRGERLVNVAS